MYNEFLNKIYSVDKIDNFHELIYRSAEKYGNKPAFVQKDNTVSYNQLKIDYDNLCSNMLKMNLDNQRIAVIGNNSYEWAFTYICAATVGVAVPLDKELHSDDLIQLIQKSDCKAVFADDIIINKLSKILPNMQYVPLNESSARTFYPHDEIVQDCDRLSVIIFTSGTTGKEKGVCLSQKNICSNIMSTAKMVNVTSKEYMLSVLPLHHTYECTLGLLMPLYCGVTISYCSSLKAFANELNLYRPSMLICVPLLLDHVLKRIRKTLINEVPDKYKTLFKENNLNTALQSLSFILRFIIVKKIRKSLGSKLKLCIVGAASMNPDVSLDLMALGIKVLEGYGLTECSPLLAGNNDFYNNIGSVGFPIPDVEVKIHNPNADGVGEIIAKGDNIMLGYFEDTELTNEYIKDGYFHTGDLGCFDDNGFLYIKGRIKNVIITNNGKNVYPEELETIISDYELVREVIICEDISNKGEIKVKAKILPDMDKINELFGMIPSPAEIYEMIGKLINDFNSKVPSYKHISIYEVLMTELEKTTSKKIKRYGANTI